MKCLSLTHLLTFKQLAEVFGISLHRANEGQLGFSTSEFLRAELQGSSGVLQKTFERFEIFTVAVSPGNTGMDG